MPDNTIDHTTENIFGKGITFAAPIDLNAKKPLDSRLYVSNLTELNDHYTSKRCYPGMQVFVASEALTYIYFGENEDSLGNKTPVWGILADRDWVTNQIVSAGGMSEARVRQIIQEVLTEREQSGELDDIKVYTYGPRNLYTVTVTTLPQPEGDSSILYYIESIDTYYKWKNNEYSTVIATDYEEYFPLIGLEGVQYVDKYKSIEYIWSDSEQTYKPVNEVASNEDIRRLF